MQLVRCYSTSVRGRSACQILATPARRVEFGDDQSMAIAPRLHRRASQDTVERTKFGFARSGSRCRRERGSAPRRSRSERGERGVSSTKSASSHGCVECSSTTRACAPATRIRRSERRVATSVSQAAGAGSNERPMHVPGCRERRGDRRSSSRAQPAAGSVKAARAISRSWRRVADAPDALQQLDRHDGRRGRPNCVDRSQESPSVSHTP